MDRLRSERNFAVQKEIGRILRQQYDLPEDLPEQFQALLAEVDKGADNQEETYGRQFY